MKYKRNETFRYPFEVPIPCIFRISKVDERVVPSKTGEALIYDLSQGGMKLTTPLYIPIDNRKIEVEISFILNQEQLTFTGFIIWMKKMSKEHSYGVKFSVNKLLQRKLIEELKTYAKGVSYIKKKT